LSRQTDTSSAGEFDTDPRAASVPRRGVFGVALLALTLATSAASSFAADKAPAAPAPAAQPATGKPPAAQPPAGQPQAGAAAPASSKKTAPAAPAKLVDINSASKKELKTLTGIGDAEADRIIAGRPYNSKADLASRDVLPTGVYISIKNSIIAKQAAKPNPKK
jgi:DNA uptake protein ComE-like DNA-binding protein